MLVMCSSIVICGDCARGDHDHCNGMVIEAKCIEHGDFKSCRCYCCAHPDNRDAVRQRLGAMGFESYT
jgi:hypothetical protein